MELQCHRAGFAALRERLKTVSFIALWGRSVALRADGGWDLLEDGVSPESDGLVLRLDPHLFAIRDGFALPGAPSAGQLDLFSLPAVRATTAVETPTSVSIGRAA